MGGKTNESEAVFEGNWPHPEEHGKQDIYINNQHPHNGSVLEEDRRSPNRKQNGQFAQKQVTGHPPQRIDTNQGQAG